jgi:hypothetical protein
VQQQQNSSAFDVVFHYSAEEEFARLALCSSSYDGSEEQIQTPSQSCNCGECLVRRCVSFIISFGYVIRFNKFYRFVR